MANLKAQKIYLLSCIDALKDDKKQGETSHQAFSKICNTENDCEDLFNIAYNYCLDEENAESKMDEFITKK